MAATLLAEKGMPTRGASGSAASDEQQEASQPDAESQILMFGAAGEAHRRRRLLGEDAMALENGDVILLVIMPHDKKNYPTFRRRC